MAGIPCLMFDTELNRESSALPYLTQGDVGKDIEAGIAQSNSEYFKMLTRMVQERSMRKSIHEEQFKRLKEKEGRTYLFAKDYLNYFLGTKLKLMDID